MGDIRTPKTPTVRTGWLKGHPFPLATDPDERLAEFDRWLAAHDREVRVATLREAADRIETFDGNDFLRALVGINGGATALLEYVLTTLREETEGGAS